MHVFRKILYFVIVILWKTDVSLASIVEWTFQVIPKTYCIKPSTGSSVVCKNKQNQITDCFLLCIQMDVCSAVTVNSGHCYCTTELTPPVTLFHTNTFVYVKRPAKVCTHPEYIYYKHSCLRIGTKARTWLDAKRDCEKTGGDLAVLDSTPKMIMTRMFLSSYSHMAEEYFVGASHIAREGHWMWVNGSTYLLSTWPTYKMSIDASKNCAVFKTNGVKFEAGDCTEKKLYICDGLV